MNFFDVSVGAADYMATHLGGPAAHDCRYGLEFVQRFRWPGTGEQVSIEISTRELSWLLEGLDITRTEAHKAVIYSLF